MRFIKAGSRFVDIDKVKSGKIADDGLVLLYDGFGLFGVIEAEYADAFFEEIGVKILDANPDVLPKEQKLDDAAPARKGSYFNFQTLRRSILS